MSCHVVQTARARQEPIGSGAHLRLEPNPSSVGAARRFVRAQLAGHPEATIQDASLLVSELVTNTIVHVGTSFVVGVIVDETEVLVAVADDRPDRVPVRGHMPAAEDIVEMGRGISIVRLVASDFGWHLPADCSGKVVWFSLDPGTGGAAGLRYGSSGQAAPVGSPLRQRWPPQEAAEVVPCSGAAGTEPHADSCSYNVPISA